jgi:serine/threonine-protein kinase
MTLVLLNNRYQIVSTLARGGFGETYIAIDTNMPSQRRCVIKKLQPAIQSEGMPEWLKERFQKEASVLEELGEQNRQIPRLYGYFAQDNDFYLVQEWIEGETLTQKQQRQGNLSSSVVQTILVNLLPILDFIHSRRIIHRDVKPDNIILRNSDNLPVLIDFGVMKEAVATLLDPTGKSAYSIALGTPGYMASEQAAGRPVFSSDLYSLGLTAIFLLTGKTPQYLETDSRSGEILWRQEAENVNPNLAMVLDRAIRFHPRDRFASAKEMLAALTEITPDLSTQPTIAVSPHSPKLKSSTPQKPKVSPTVVLESTPGEKKNPWLSIFLIFAVTMGAFALGYLGFMAFLPKNREIEPFPTPEPSPSPEIIPLPSQDFPPIRRPSPKRTPVYQPTPTPEETPSPIPEETPSPTPEATPSPTPEEVIPIPVPLPETEPIPEVSPSPFPSPSPEVINPPVNEDKIEPIAPPVLEPSPTPPEESSN